MRLNALRQTSGGHKLARHFWLAHSSQVQACIHSRTHAYFLHPRIFALGPILNPYTKKYSEHALVYDLLDAIELSEEQLVL
jgi:hypothetical protein